MKVPHEQSEWVNIREIWDDIKYIKSIIELFSLMFFGGIIKLLSKKDWSTQKKTEVWYQVSKYGKHLTVIKWDSCRSHTYS